MEDDYRDLDERDLDRPQTGVAVGQECETCGGVMGELHCPTCQMPAEGTEEEAYTIGWNASNQHEERAAPRSWCSCDREEWLRGYDACDFTASFNTPDGDSPQY